MSDSDRLVCEFLKLHPQYVSDVAQKDFGDGPQTALSAPAAVAFTRWAVRTGRFDPAKAERLIAAMEGQFPDAPWEA